MLLYLNELRLFEAIDEDKSGTITMEEMKKALASKGDLMPEEDLKALIKAADVDGGKEREMEIERMHNATEMR